MADNEAPTLESVNNLADYRALREGRSVEKVSIEEPPSDAKPGEKTPPADAGTGAESETARETVEEKETSEDGDDSKQEQKGDDKKPGQKKGGLVDEVIKLRRENRELKQRTAAAPPPAQQEGQPKPAGAPAEAARAQGAPADDPEPDVTKYTDYNLYNRDLVRWEIRQEQKRAASEQQQREQQTAQQQRVTTWNSRVSAAAAKPELQNFEAIAFNTTLDVSPIMGDAIMDSDLGPEILYHLGSNPAEATRISKLSPIAQVREIGKLEASLAKPAADPSASDEDEPTPQKQAISKAPAPVPRPAGSPGKPNPARNIEGMSQQEYRELRESGKLR